MDNSEALKSIADSLKIIGEFIKDNRKDLQKIIKMGSRYSETMEEQLTMFEEAQRAITKMRNDEFPDIDNFFKK